MTNLLILQKKKKILEANFYVILRHQLFNWWDSKGRSFNLFHIHQKKRYHSINSCNYFVSCMDQNKSNLVTSSQLEFQRDDSILLLHYFILLYAGQRQKIHREVIGTQTVGNDSFCYCCRKSSKTLLSISLIFKESISFASFSLKSSTSSCSFLM